MHSSSSSFLKHRWVSLDIYRQTRYLQKISMLINKYLSRCIHIDSYPYESVRIYKHKCNTNTDWPLANTSEYLWTPMNIRPFQLGVLYKYEHSHSTNTYGCKCGWKPPTNLGNVLTSQYKRLCEYLWISSSICEFSPASTRRTLYG